MTVCSESSEWREQRVMEWCSLGVSHERCGCATARRERAHLPRRDRAAIARPPPIRPFCSHIRRQNPPQPRRCRARTSVTAACIAPRGMSGDVFLASTRVPREWRQTPPPPCRRVPPPSGSTGGVRGAWQAGDRGLLGGGARRLEVVSCIFSTPGRDPHPGLIRACVRVGSTVSPPDPIPPLSSALVVGQNVSPKVHRVHRCSTQNAAR